MTGQTLRICDGEPEKLCRKCGEWWPATDEFFFRNPRNKSNFRAIRKKRLISHIYLKVHSVVKSEYKVDSLFWRPQ